MYIDLSRRGLQVVPQNINTHVTYLLLNENDISRITNTSIALYKELRVLEIWTNDLTYIEDGSFDHNPKLETLSAGNNLIMQLPQSFGVAEKSLSTIHFWCALRDPAISSLNLSQMRSLKWLNLGCGNYHGKFDAALLPPNLEYICFNHGGLTEFPDFGRFTPNLTTIQLSSNDVSEIPNEYIANISTLKELYLDNNRLLTVPYLYHLPLIDLHLSNNPLVCNQSLCWIRMSPWMKTPPLITDDITCETPGSLHLVPLMDINPITLGCENGA